MSKQAWLIKELRNVHRKWLPKDVAKRNSRVSRGKYKCAHCGDLFGPRDVQIDHITPTVDPETGFIDWNTYIDRLFIETEGYQILCKGCHKFKSNLENEVRYEKRRNGEY